MTPITPDHLPKTTAPEDYSGRMKAAFNWMYNNWIHWPEILTEARADRNELKKLTDRLSAVIVDHAPGTPAELAVRSGPQGKMDIAELDEGKNLLEVIARKHQAIDKQFPHPATNPAHASKRNNFWLKEGKSSYLEAKRLLVSVLDKLRDADYWGTDTSIQERAEELENRLRLVIHDEKEPETLSSHEDVETLINDLASLESDMKKLRRTKNVATRYLHTLEDFEKIVRERLMNRAFWRTAALAKDGKNSIAEQAEKILHDYREAIRPSNPEEDSNVVGIDKDKVIDLRNKLLKLTDEVYNQINRFRVSRPEELLKHDITSEGFLHEFVLQYPRRIVAGVRDGISGVLNNRTIQNRTEILPYKAKRNVKNGLQKIQPIAKKIAKKTDVAIVAFKDGVVEGVGRTASGAINTGKRVRNVTIDTVQKLRNIAL